MSDLYKLAKQYLPEQLPLIEQFMAAKAVSQEVPNVVVYGVYNTGKSSLLNSLTGHVETEFFKTGDVPETRSNKKLEQNGICYIDTPGLDVNMADTAAANQGAFQADIILFVHKLSAGPIQKEDLMTMASIAHSHGSVDKVFLVLTEGETAQENQSLIDAITEQCQTELAAGITPLLVSNSMYKKGILESKPALVKASGIPQLQQQLEQQLQVDFVADRKARVASLSEEIILAILIKKAELHNKGAEMHLAAEQQEESFINTVKNMQATLAKQLTQIQSI